jgi:hypothetical protein
LVTFTPSHLLPVIRAADVPDAKLARSDRKARVESTAPLIDSARREKFPEARAIAYADDGYIKAKLSVVRFWLS